MPGGATKKAAQNGSILATVVLVGRTNFRAESHTSGLLLGQLFF